MEQCETFDNAVLNRAGLNRQAVFNIDKLPADIAACVRASCTSMASAGRQLILIGHAGTALWDALKKSGIATADPIDDFTVRTVRRWFAEYHAHRNYEIIYPGPAAIGLQGLGQLAGWHHATPFMVGIDRRWGTWYAYRAVVIADTRFAPTRPAASTSPCASCEHTLCISNCAAAALEGGRFDMQKCLAYRKLPGSRCKATCLARISCPVGSAHRYADEQIHHIYANSMRFIERYY